MASVLSLSSPRLEVFKRCCRAGGQMQGHTAVASLALEVLESAAGRQIVVKVRMTLLVLERRISYRCSNTKPVVNYILDLFMASTPVRTRTLSRQRHEGPECM